MSENQHHLIRGLQRTDTIALVVGTVIGTGIFLKTSTTALLVGSAPIMVLAWAVAGVISLCGALTYAELGVRFPHAGGEYVFLREAYGRLPAFLFGWMRFFIATPGSIAAYSVGAAHFLGSSVDLDHLWIGRSGFSILLIFIFSVSNCLTVHFSGKLQLIFTCLKISLIGLLSFGAFFFISEPSHLWSSLSPASMNLNHFSITAFGMALISALWAFDGWNNMPMVAGEVHNPGKNIPIALGAGIGLVMLIYTVTNLAYLHSLTWDEILSANSHLHPSAPPIATLTAIKFLGPLGVIALSFAMLISAVGSMNGAILTGSRVPYAMAKDNLFFNFLSKLTQKSRVPYISVMIQGLWASILALSGTFDQLTDMVVFASFIFYLATTCTVFVFRKKDSLEPLLSSEKRMDSNHFELNSPLSYKTWGYPWVPLAFIFSSVLILINTVYTMPLQSFLGLGLIILGVPVFFWREKKPQNKEKIKQEILNRKY